VTENFKKYVLIVMMTVVVFDLKKGTKRNKKKYLPPHLERTRKGFATKLNSKPGINPKQEKKTMKLTTKVEKNHCQKSSSSRYMTIITSN